MPSARFEAVAAAVNELGLAFAPCGHSILLFPINVWWCSSSTLVGATKVITWCPLEGDGEAVSQCFTENAVVEDVGHTHKGRAGIKDCKTDSSAKYEYTCEPIACEEKKGRTVVTSHLVGNFPGSPVDLRFFFKLEGDKIASLEIIP